MDFDQESPPGGSTVDVVLQASDGHHLTVSRRLLAAESGYFRALFYGNYRDSASSSLNVPFSSDLVMEMVELMRKLVAEEQVPIWSLTRSCELLNPITYLQMDRLLPHIQNSITSQIDIGNLLKVYRYAQRRDLTLADQLWKQLLKYFHKMAVSEEYQKMSEDELLVALRDERLNIQSQNEQKVIDDYVGRHDETTRLQHLQLRHTGDGTDDHGVVMDRLPQEVLLAYGGWSSAGPTDAVEVFNPRNERWIQVESMSGESRAYSSLSRQDNRLIVCGGMSGREYYRSVKAYDMDKKTWTQLPDLIERRCYTTSVTIPFTDGSSQLMVLGGYNSVDRLSSCELVSSHHPIVWNRVKSMNRARSDGAAVIVADGVMAVGGFDGRNVHQDGEMFDVATNAWYSLNRRMHHPRTGNCSVALNRNVAMVAGGFNGQSRLATCEFYDIREGKWHILPKMSKTRSNFSLELLNGEVYAVGGFDGLTTTATAERLDMVAQRWSPLADVSLARSALKMIRLSDHDILRQLINFDQQ